jgi:tetratricopeptide (TPR) repeat protein
MNDAERTDLVAEREFLQRSISDLEAEHAAGDLATEDFAELRDEYVARAAFVTNALDSNIAAVPAAARGRDPRRTALTVVACLAVAGLAGVALAAAAGSRPAGSPLSGSLPDTTSERLNRASELTGAGKPVEALKIYDAILKQDPKQPVALAYRGWLIRLAGLKEQGLGFEDRAVAADPSYPDAHFFRGMMLWQDKSDPAGAVAEFRLFLSNRPPASMVALVQDALERAAAEAGIPTK